MTSFEDKIQVEDRLRKQHLDILKIIKDENSSLPFAKTVAANKTTKSTVDKIATIPGVEKIFHLDNDGNFTSKELSDEFCRKFSAVSRNLPEVLNIFGCLPDGQRETGVCEIESERLYIASGGDGYYFVLVKPNMAQAGYESEIKAAISD